MNHKHDVNQVLLKFGLLLTTLVGMAPLSKTILILNNFLSFCDLSIPIHTCDSWFLFLFFLFFQKLNNITITII